MIKTFFATTALVGVLFIAQPVKAAEPIPDILWDYVQKSKLLTKYQTQMETYQGLIDDTLKTIQSTPSTAELALLNKYVTADLTATKNYQTTLNDFTQDQQQFVQAEQEYYEQTVAKLDDPTDTAASLIPLPPPPPPFKQTTTAQVEATLKETEPQMEQEAEKAFVTSEETKYEAQKKVPTTADIRSDANAFVNALKSQASSLKKVQATVTSSESTAAFANDPTAKKESDSLLDILRNGLNAKFAAANKIDEEVDEESWDEWLEEDIAKKEGKVIPSVSAPTKPGTTAPTSTTKPATTSTKTTPTSTKAPAATKK